MSSDVSRDPWDTLRAATRARVGLGRAGDGLSTAENLRLAAAHAQARDAVHAPLDADAVLAALGERAGPVVRSRVADRTEYVQRPDLERVFRRKPERVFEEPRRLPRAPSQQVLVLAPEQHELRVVVRAEPVPRRTRGIQPPPRQQPPQHADPPA